MKQKAQYKNIDYYLSLPWKYIIEEDVDNDGKKIYVIRVKELAGLATDGYSLDEAMESVKEAMTLLFEVSLKAGDVIPEPIDENNYDGNIAYRTSPRRHYFIAQEAEKRNLSLSQVIDAIVDSIQLSKK